MSEHRKTTFQKENPNNQERSQAKELWHILHSVAINYPDKPSTEDKSNMKTFLNLFPRYVMSNADWGDHFIENTENDPPKLGSKKDFVEWMCIQHNYINKRVGKPEFDCSFENLKKHWAPL